jgi:hypothetical protein
MNVFEGVTKEMFIKMYNERNNFGVFIIGSDLLFEYVVIKSRRKYKQISDIPNYESEIEVFNSFDVIRKYEGETIIICDNLKKYFNHRKIKKEVTIYTCYYNLKCRKSINAFNAYVKKADKIKASYEIAKKLIEANKEKAKKLIEESNEIAKKLIEEQINPFIKSIEDILEPKLSFLDFNYKTEYTYKIIVEEFDKLNKEQKLTKKHLTKNNFINSFKLNTHITKNTFNDETKLEYYVIFKNEFYDAILETAAYLKYDVYGVNDYYFKKIKD